MEREDYILGFVVRLGRELLECGANLERVNLTIETICKSYGMREVSIFSLSTYISVSVQKSGGGTGTRGISVPINGIHLEKLCRLSRMADMVCRERPEPEKLEDILFQTLLVPNYSTGITILGYLMAMSCLCVIFGGKVDEVIIAGIGTVLLYYVFIYFVRIKMNRIITNTVCMFLAGTIALGSYHMGLVDNFYAVIITNAFFLIPGIPMVNATRNLLCGNEINGIVELTKAVLEVVTIVFGLFVACCLFGRNIPFG